MAGSVQACYDKKHLGRGVGIPQSRREVRAEVVHLYVDRGALQESGIARAVKIAVISQCILGWTWAAADEYVSYVLRQYRSEPLTSVQQ